MLKLSRLLLGLTLIAGVSLPAVAALPGGLSNTSAVQQRAQYVSAEGLSLIPPAGWKAEKGSGKSIMTYMGPVENNFKVNFNVTMTDDDGTTAKQLSAVLHPVYAKQFENWKVMSEGITRIAGVDAYYISSYFTMQGLEIQNLQYFFPGKSERYYILTFTALATNYAKYEKAFQQTAASSMTRAD